MCKCVVGGGRRGAAERHGRHGSPLPHRGPQALLQRGTHTHTTTTTTTTHKKSRSRRTCPGCGCECLGGWGGQAAHRAGPPQSLRLRSLRSRVRIFSWSWAAKRHPVPADYCTERGGEVGGGGASDPDEASDSDQANDWNQVSDPHHACDSDHGSDSGQSSGSY